MAEKGQHTPGFRLDGCCIPDPLGERPAGVLVPTLEGEHGCTDGEERAECEVLVFDGAAEDDADMATMKEQERIEPGPGPGQPLQRGAAFEQRSLQLLQAHLSMALRRVGGRADGGIDLVGWWWLPFVSPSDPDPSALPDPRGLMRRRLRVLAQCKAHKKKFSPKYVREMEGVWHLHSSPPSLHPTVALLLSESPFSKATALHAYRSTVPFLLIHIPPCESSPTPPTHDTDIGTVCPNPALTHLVNPLEFCWERNPSASPDTHRPGLWWQGHKLGSWAPDLPSSETI
ncbi:hypothetical protein HD554DRAFT_2172191 [Boletus coccyginus]|nr:hypothetical protein HD554DRAFT_2172191 [Boletus coccyginus]